MDGNLRRLRERKALSRKDLSELSGVNESTIYRLEAGQVIRPNPKTTRRLAEALGINVEVLTMRQGDLGIG